MADADVVTCTHTVGAALCGTSPASRYLPGSRCAAHTPAALAGRPETIPDPARTLTGLRAAAGIVTPPTPSSPPSRKHRRRVSLEYQAARDELRRLEGGAA